MTERAFCWVDVSTLKRWGGWLGEGWGLGYRGVWEVLVGESNGILRGLLYFKWRSRWQLMQKGSKLYILHHFHKRDDNHEYVFVNTLINQKIFLNFVQIHTIILTFPVKAITLFWRSWLSLEIFFHHTLWKSTTWGGLEIFEHLLIVENNNYIN